MSPLASDFTEIHWLATPLALDQRSAINKKLQEVLGSDTTIQVPAQENDSLRKVHHWTLKIGEQCYEVSPKKNGLTIVRLFTDACEPHVVSVRDWYRRCDGFGVRPEERKVGVTRWTEEEIREEVSTIWKNYNNDQYLPLTQNCQNFVKMLFESIAVSKDDEAIGDSEKHEWKKMPTPIGYRLADASRVGLLGGAAYGTQTTYLAALATLAQTSEAGAATVLTTTGAAAEGIEVATVAGGSTTTAVGGAGSATAAGGGSQAAGMGAGQAATVEGTATAKGAVGGAGAVKGAATGGTGAAKIGFGAKFAGMGHVALHGAGAVKAASIGGAMINVGGTAAIVHPIAGAAIAGTGAGFIYLGTRGKRDIGWMQRKRREQPADIKLDPNQELSAEKIMQLEVELLEHGKDADTEVEEDNLVEGVKLL